jgi:hypothetical protein
MVFPCKLFSTCAQWISLPVITPFLHRPREFEKEN